MQNNLLHPIILHQIQELMEIIKETTSIRDVIRFNRGEQAFRFSSNSEPQSINLTITDKIKQEYEYLVYEKNRQHNSIFQDII